ncbi:MAG: hypothetical protein EU549_05305 [Promethearchaeota archaeon]|nr:MAG: hypothetical protein EU549_05305 [Candidatus Lokiarchaeota archaeon]
MLELISYNEEVLNSRDRVALNLLKDGENFLEQFETNHELLIDTVSLIHKYLQITNKIPHNLFKYYIAAYYIVSRHPMAFPHHESKKEFSHQYGIKVSSLDYCVDRLIKALKLIKIMDDMQYPYFIDPYKDIGYKLAKSIVEDEIDKRMMDFLLKHQQINPKIISEELTLRFVFEMNIFPEELFRQIYYLVDQMVEEELQDFLEYKKLQTKYLI